MKSFIEKNNAKTLFFCFIISGVFLSCNNRSRKTAENDFYLTDNEVVIAKGFSICRSDGFVKITITNPWQGASDVSYEHYLIQKGLPIPE